LEVSNLANTQENTQFTESILNSTTLEILKALNFVQGNASVVYTADGTKLTVKADSHPSQYLKDDGTVIFASDIIAKHYHIDKTAETIEQIYTRFKHDYDYFYQRRTYEEKRRKEDAENAEFLRRQVEQQQREEQLRKADEDRQRSIIQAEREKAAKIALQHLENKQVYPNRIRIDANDVATKSIFSLNKQQFLSMLHDTNNWRWITERNKTKKKEQIQSNFKLFNINGYINETPPDEYDRAVLSYLSSEFLKGNRYVTFQMIQRGISGKVGKSNVEYKLNKNQAEHIEKSVLKLMGTLYKIDADTKDAYQKLNYDADKVFSSKIETSALLPACIVTSTINGQEVKAVFMDRLSPLYLNADMKNQILRFPAILLDVQGQNNTPLVVALKNYCVRRVVEIIQHKMPPTLTLNDIFEKCRNADGIRIKNTSNKDKQRARDYIDKIFAHLQDIGYIDSYEWRKTGGKFDAVTFHFSPSKIATFNDKIFNSEPV
jgi:hypothetical protein